MARKRGTKRARQDRLFVLDFENVKILLRDISQEDHLEWCSYDSKQPEAESQLTCFVDLDHGFLKKEILHQDEPQVIS